MTPPPSDTIERLPEDFWDSASAAAEAAEGASRPMAIDEPPVEPADAERAAASEPSRMRPSGASAGVAVLQRLFPGRVLGVEPHAGDEGGADDASASVDESTAIATDDAPPDDPADEGGLESGRSRP